MAFRSKIIDLLHGNEISENKKKEIEVCNKRLFYENNPAERYKLLLTINSLKNG